MPLLYLHHQELSSKTLLIGKSHITLSITLSPYPPLPLSLHRLYSLWICSGFLPTGKFFLPLLYLACPGAQLLSFWLYKAFWEAVRRTNKRWSIELMERRMTYVFSPSAGPDAVTWNEEHSPGCDKLMLIASVFFCWRGETFKISRLLAISPVSFRLVEL